MTSAAPNAVYCYDKKQRPTGYRMAMTQQQMQFYLAQRAYQAQEMAALTAQLNATANTWAQAGEAIRAQSSSFTPPAVAPLNSPLNSYDVKCITTGIYTNCRGR